MFAHDRAMVAAASNLIDEYTSALHCKFAGVLTPRVLGNLNGNQTVSLSAL